MINNYNIFDLGFNKHLNKGEDQLFGILNEELPMPSILGSGFFEIPPSQIGSGELTQNITMITGLLQSSNFVTGVSGWQFAYDGNLEANEGTFRGTLIAGSIHIPDTTTANSFHTDSDGNTWWGATAIGSAVAKVLKTGAATFTSITITGLQAGSALDGQYISVGTIDANKMNVSQLSAIAADIGSITAGIITGATIQTDAGATDGIKIDDVNLRGYDVLGDISFEIDRFTGEMSASNYRLRGVPSIRKTYIAGENIAAYRPVYLKTEDGKVYIANSVAQVEVDNFIGFTAETATTGNPVEVQQTGTIRDPGEGPFNFGLLTPGDSYYLAAETINDSAVNFYLKVGTALDEHTLRLEGSGFTRINNTDRTFNPGYTNATQSVQQITSAYEDEPAYFFQIINETISDTIHLYRYTKSGSGMYMYDGNNFNTSVASSSPMGVIQIGGFLYISYFSVGQEFCKRYNLDFTGETTMTLDGDVFAASGEADFGYLATDGVNLYIAGATQIRKLSISGTDLTFVSKVALAGDKYGFFIDKDDDETLHYYLMTDGIGTIKKYSQSVSLLRTTEYKLASDVANINQCRGIVKLENTFAIMSYLNASDSGELIATSIPKF